MIFKYLVRTSKIARRASIRKTNQLVLYMEIMIVYFENHTEDMSIICG